ncbi:hypothetical protein HQ619_07655 [Burkholderia gladioli]|uniref:hypothetical protein n=1 Tax=Burkholderia gladioli TaxID=28095 RepID=UPI00155F89F4|nr:hypothetical protein [Burkholderia gladioli]NRF83801.1 hypothetical protein [Burkholderia gladioli]
MAQQTPKAPLFIGEDEFRISPAETLSMRRFHRHSLSAGGWLIGERFDDRYDTEVGGSHMIVAQSIDQNGRLVGGLDFTKIGQYPTEPNSPTIVDYGDGGKAISVQEAEARPELAAVLARLRERVAAHAAHVASRR